MIRHQASEVSGVDGYGAEYKRTPNDFRFRRLEQDNCVCSICHGTGAKIEFEYVTRNYESPRKKNRICKTLQAHGHSFWICPACIDNLVTRSQGLVGIMPLSAQPERKKGESTSADMKGGQDEQT